MRRVASLRVWAVGLMVLVCCASAWGAETVAGWLSPCEMIYHIVRTGEPPMMEGAAPLEDASWKRAEVLGPLFRMGQPERPEAATTVRMVVCQGQLYVGLRCLDPQPAAIKAGRDPETIWQDDSIEMTFTAGGSERYPYAHVQINAAGLVRAGHHLQPFAYGRGPLRRAIDPKHLRVRAGVDTHGWWAVLATPLEVLGIEADAFHGNVVRNRSVDGSDAAWRDLWGGSVYKVSRLQPMRIVESLPPPAPQLEVPARLAVGENRLRWYGWREGLRLRINGQPVAVGADGVCVARIAERGTADVRVTDADGATVVAYTTEVARPVLIEADEPFQEDATKPVAVTVTVDVTGGPVELELAGQQDGKEIGRRKVSLDSGVHRLELPCKDARAGEVRLVARGSLPAAGEPIPLRAEHWCVVGQSFESRDHYREGLIDRPTLGMYRAALADACDLFHVLQAGDGQYRSMGRGGVLRKSDRNCIMVYAFALVYTADWPENPHRGDPRMLASAIAGMEGALAPEQWHELIKHPPNRQLQSYLLTYEALKDQVEPALAAYWRDRLIRLIDCTIELWIEPATHVSSFFSENTGTGTNHYAYHLANVYAAGRIFGRPEWISLGERMMRRLAGHEREGHFPEQRSGAVIHYTWLTVNAVGEYYWQSGDEEVAEALRRCVDFAWRIAIPGGQAVIVHESRNNDADMSAGRGDFVLSLTPEGRYLAREAMVRHVSSGRVSRSSDETWFRIAENAIYFRTGPEKAPPAEYAYEFLDGQAVIARQQGWIYGISAECARATAQTYRVDQQNAVELNHATIGRILSGANSQQQPEAGTFCRKLKDRTVFLPWEGAIERMARGHAARLEFDTFQTQVTCEVLSARRARITVQLLKAEGDEPVFYSFFPVAKGVEDLATDGPLQEMKLADVTIRCSQPVQLERGFRIMDPYSQTMRVTSKPVRAYTILHLDRPVVVEVEIGADIGDKRS